MIRRWQIQPVLPDIDARFDRRVPLKAVLERPTIVKGQRLEQARVSSIGTLAPVAPLDVNIGTAGAGSASGHRNFIQNDVLSVPGLGDEEDGLED